MRFGLLLAALALSPVPVAAQIAPGTAAAPDYRQAAAWLCRPGRNDACTADEDITVVNRDGVGKIERFKASAAPKFDCFYVYPTVSDDKEANSDLIPGAEETQVAQAQAARFRAHCRVFAPMYRQVTLTALRQIIATGKTIGDRAMSYGDVLAAWRQYLAHDNGGRGIVLIGHSQGSNALRQLIASEIDGKPIQKRIIAAYLAGTNIAPGDFTSMRPCRRDTQTGCYVSWVTFRADAPPPATARFGRIADRAAICVNAAALGGGKAVSHPIFTTAGAGLTSKPMGPGAWASGSASVGTPFVSTPGLISTECVEKDGFAYLAMTVNGDPADARTDTINGDILVGTTVLKDWGMHLQDMPVVMGDLIALSDRQARAWLAKR